MSSCDEEAGLAHHQEVAHAAAVVAEIDDLVVDLVGRAAEHDAGVDQILHAAAAHVDDAAVLGEAARRRLAAQHARVVLDREIAGRIAERRMHDAAERR